MSSTSTSHQAPPCIGKSTQAAHVPMGMPLCRPSPTSNSPATIPAQLHMHGCCRCPVTQINLACTATVLPLPWQAFCQPFHYAKLHALRACPHAAIVYASVLTVATMLHECRHCVSNTACAPVRVQRAMHVSASAAPPFGNASIQEAALALKAGTHKYLDVR